jgi:hypothetical protein
LAFHAATFRFGPNPESGETALPGKAPRPLSFKNLARRIVVLREAYSVLGHLQQPGEALHALMTGR